MAIYKPGQLHRYHRLLGRRKNKRSVTAILSLTAMVDMFTVLVIFLLQNYNATGEIIYIPKEVVLPKATAVKDLKPSHVVTISSKEILLDKDVLATFEEVQKQEDWVIPRLKEKLQEALAKTKLEQEAKIQNKIRDAVKSTQGLVEEDKNSWSKVTVQADKGVDFLTIKKVLYTATEAGAGEINFAVTKLPDESVSQ